MQYIYGLAYLGIGFSLATLAIYFDEKQYFREILVDKFLFITFLWPVFVLVLVIGYFWDLLERYIKWILK